MSVPSGNRQSSRNAKAVMNIINFVLLISYSEWYNSSEGCWPLTGFLYLLKLSMIEANPFNTMPSPVNRIPTAFSRSAISLSFLFDTICSPLLKTYKKLLFSYRKLTFTFHFSFLPPKGLSHPLWLVQARSYSRLM